MSNKLTVEKYLEGFRRSDHAMVLSTVTDDIEWILPGAFVKHGKKEVDGEIENDCFEPRPQIAVTRMTEENGVVIAEGTVRTVEKSTGKVINLVFCDVFEMRDGLIKKLTSYLMNV